MPPFTSDNVLTLVWLFITVIVWRGLRTESSWTYRPLNCSYQTRTVAPVTWKTATTIMSKFTNAEYADMHLVYGFCDGIPSLHWRFISIDIQIGDCLTDMYSAWHFASWSETGTPLPQARADRGRRNAHEEWYVLDIVHDNASTSTVHISSETGGISQSPVRRTVCENQLYPLHVQVVQGLQPKHILFSLQISRWLLYKYVDTPHFRCRVL